MTIKERYNAIWQAIMDDGDVLPLLITERDAHATTEAENARLRTALAELRDALAILPEDSDTYDIYRNVQHALSPQVDTPDDAEQEATDD